jgi:hypothetical protein
MRAMRMIAIIIMAAGAFSTWILGRNYGACQLVVALGSSSHTCTIASEYHLMGIIAMIAGTVWFLLTFMPVGAEPGNQITRRDGESWHDAIGRDRDQDDPG